MGCQAGEGNLWISHYLHSHWSFLDALGPQPNSIFPLVHFNDHFISSPFILSLWLNPRLISFTFQCEILPFWLYFNSNFNFPWPIPFQFEIQSPLLIFKAVSPSFNLSIKCKRPFDIFPPIWEIWNQKWMSKVVRNRVWQFLKARAFVFLNTQTLPTLP